MLMFSQDGATGKTVEKLIDRSSPGFHSDSFHTYFVSTS